MKRIVIEAIPHAEHRYPTLGDYFVDQDGAQRILVSKLYDPRMSLCIALHEFIEIALTEQRHIGELEIMKFDVAHPELSDPGNDPRAPYHREHVLAEAMERLFADALGLSWVEYTHACEALCES